MLLFDFLIDFNFFLFALSGLFVGDSRGAGPFRVFDRSFLSQKSGASDMKYTLKIITGLVFLVVVLEIRLFDPTLSLISRCNHALRIEIDHIFQRIAV